jgi:uncharacterized membrane protein (DUF4010 family)
MTIDYPSDIWTVFIWMIVTLALFLSAVSFEAIMMKCLGWGNWKASILLTVVASTFIKVCILSYTRRKPLPKLLWAAIITTNSISSITYFFLVAAGLMRLLEILLQQKT